jgi:hypothetical protein
MFILRHCHAAGFDTACEDQSGMKTSYYFCSTLCFVTKSLKLLSRVRTAAVLGKSSY